MGSRIQAVETPLTLFMLNVGYAVPGSVSPQQKPSRVFREAALEQKKECLVTIAPNHCTHCYRMHFLCHCCELVTRATAERYTF